MKDVTIGFLLGVLSAGFVYIIHGQRQLVAQVLDELNSLAQDVHGHTEKSGWVE